MTKGKVLKELRKDIKDALKNKWTNYSVIFFGIVLSILILISYSDKIFITLPSYVTNVLKVLILIFSTYFIAALIVRVLVNHIIKSMGSDLEIERQLLLRKLYAFLVYMLATLYILWRVGFGLQNITIVLSLMTTGLAFAVRDIIMSYLSWYILLTKKPFRIGDYIKIGDDEGKVMHIGTFYVLIDNNPNIPEDFVRVPTRMFIEKPIQNFGQKNVLHTIKFYLSKIPPNYDKKISLVLKKIRSELQLEATASLDYDQDKKFIRFELRSDYSRKTEIKNKVLIIADKYF